MKYLFIAFLFVLNFGYSQGIEPSSFQPSPYKSGILKSSTLIIDEFTGDSTYLYVHVDSLGLADSIYLQGDSLILLKNGSGQVYKNRIHTGYFSSYDVPNPKKYDIYVSTSEDSYWYDGSDWILFDGDTDSTNEGNLTLHDIATNVAAIRSNTNYFNAKKFVGLNGIQISTNELDSLNIGIDTTLFSGETQYLNPYVVGADTVGFYLTVAVDTVLFQNTIDTASYCCPPSIGNDTLYIGDNYVVLPSGEATTVGDTPTINMTLTGVNITGEVIDGSITPAKLDRTYLTAEVDGSTTNEIELPSQTGNSGKYLSTNGTTPSWETVSGGGSSPISLKISSGNFTRTSTAQQEWTGGNFRDTITSDGYYKIELYASFISSQTTTGGSFAIRNTVTGGTDAIGFLEVSNTISTSTSGVSRITIHNTTSTAVAGTGVTNTTDKHSLYGHVTVYLTNGEIITPTFASEDTNSVTYQSGARLIITKLF